jgi:predicted  nucleic acid-binding Zn-ribbon protein
MRTYLVSWHNQLVTAQRAKSDADDRALGFQKSADSLRRELDGEKERVDRLRKSVDLSHEAQSKLQADVDSLTVQNESLRALLEEARAKLAEQQPLVEL